MDITSITPENSVGKRSNFDISDCIYIGTDELMCKTCDTAIFVDDIFEDLNPENKTKSSFKPGIWYSVYKRWYIYNKSKRK
jgi:hypothetical protein